MAKVRTLWRCQTCGCTAPKWLGRCPDCAEFGTFVEELVQRDSEALSGHAGIAAEAVALVDAGAETKERLSSGIPELDRVLGGGLVSGSLVLLGGEPGIGKSTLLLQASGMVAERGNAVLYACGEESPSQIALRAARLGLNGEGITLLPEVDASALERAVIQLHPALLVVDSIQTMYDPELSGAPGSVGQVRACTSRLMRLAKDHGVTTVIVGHVTKEGAIAGPRVLEHMVDAVLYFEGDRDHAFRVVRAVKNRFGSSSEIGMFEMGERGLLGIANPAGILLGERDDSTPGSAVMATMEGSRPLLVEIQALVTPSYLQMPRRLATGIESARLLQVVAVLERHTAISFSGQDVYVSVAGGIRIAEPAIDLPLALALLSALRGVPVPAGTVSFGEIGLTGRVRKVAHSEARMREAARQGIAQVLASVPSSAQVPDGAKVRETSSATELAAFLGA